MIFNSNSSCTSYMCLCDDMIRYNVQGNTFKLHLPGHRSPMHWCFKSTSAVLHVLPESFKHFTSFLPHTPYLHQMGGRCVIWRIDYVAKGRGGGRGRDRRKSRELFETTVMYSEEEANQRWPLYFLSPEAKIKLKQTIHSESNDERQEEKFDYLIFFVCGSVLVVISVCVWVGG